MSRPSKILFFNQMAGPLFRRTAEGLAQRWPGSVLLTGHQDTLRQELGPGLSLLPAPPYDRRGMLRRLVSWLRYLLAAAHLWWRSPRGYFLFFSSNPPMLPALGLLGRLLRRQRYATVVYDVYPQVLTRLGRLKPRGLADRLWSWFNYLVYTHAEVVFTLTPGMAQTLRAGLPPEAADKLVVVPTWVDPRAIRPIPRRQNHYFQRGLLPERFTILYAGNLGATHDVDTILRAAAQMVGRKDLQFVFVGYGAQEEQVRRAAREQANLIWLPFQPEELLPHLLSCGDVAIVSLNQAGEGLIFPSRLAYHLAAGSPVVGICRAGGDLAGVLQDWQCGLVSPPGDEWALVQALQSLRADPEACQRMGQRGRQAALDYFTPANVAAYAEALAPHLAGKR